MNHIMLICLKKNVVGRVIIKLKVKNGIITGEYEIIKHEL